MNGKSVIETLTGDNSLLDTEMQSLSVERMTDEQVRVSIVFYSFRNASRFSRVQLVFDRVEEFEFNHSSSYYFYTVSSFKFLQLESGEYYLSLDPDESDIENRSDSDNDFVVGKELRLIEL